MSLTLNQEGSFLYELNRLLRMAFRDTMKYGLVLRMRRVKLAKC
jgi:hypothetical protein